MQHNEMSHDTLLTRRELADTGICSYDKLAQDACKRVGIPHYKIGKKCIYRWGDVLEYLERNRVETIISNRTV